MFARRLFSAQKIFACIFSLTTAFACHAGDYVSLYDKLALKAPNLAKQALKSALQATQCAVDPHLDLGEQIFNIQRRLVRLAGECKLADWGSVC